MEWISVKDRLPEIGVYVLVYDVGYYDVDYLNNDDRNVNWGRSYDVTHWMPLPEPPEEII